VSLKEKLFLIEGGIANEPEAVDGLASFSGGHARRRQQRAWNEVEVRVRVWVKVIR